jgi:hypothetical protein
MTKRLPVLLKDTEYQKFQRAARSRYMSVGAWVRQALGIVRGKYPSGGVARKLDAVRTAARLEYPTAAIDAMLAEIESGSRGETNP